MDNQVDQHGTKNNGVRCPVSTVGSEQISPMDTAPAEVARIICSLLPVPAVRNIRLVNKRFASLGAEFLIPQAHLEFTPQSIKRLTEISSHPVLKHYVRSLLYEADRRNYHEVKSTWLRHIHEVFWRAYVPPPRLDEYGADSRPTERAAYVRWIQGPQRSYTDGLLHGGWKRYQAFFKEEEYIKILDLDIMNAIACFPRLTEVRVSIDGELTGLPQYLESCIADGSAGPAGLDGLKGLQPPGLTALRSVLRGLILPKISKAFGTATMGEDTQRPLCSMSNCTGMIHLATLQLGSVSPYLFSALQSKCGTNATSLFKGLRDLRLVLNYREFEDFAEFTLTKDALRELKDGSLKALLKEAINLRKMSITVDENYADWHAFDLATVIGDHTWKSLQELTFGGCHVELQYLIKVLERHQATLDDITIDEACLTTPVRHNAWAQFLLDLRTMKQWRDVTFYGSLCSGTPGGVNINKTFLMGKSDGSFYSEKKKGFRNRVRDFALRGATMNPFIHGQEDDPYDGNFDKTMFDAKDDLCTSTMADNQIMIHGF